MTIEKTEFAFPDAEDVAPKESNVEIVDDTPEVDRNRSLMKEPPKDLTDEEMSQYDESVKSRIKHFSKGYHEERRAKEAAQREHAEAVRIAQAVAAENRQLRGSLSEGQTALISQAKRETSGEYEAAKAKYRAAVDLFDADGMTEAQEAMHTARMRAEKLENFRPIPLQAEENDVKTTAPSPVDARLTEWQASNTWFGENKRMTAYALGLHADLLEEGIPVGSAKYYEKLDADLRERFPESFDADGGQDAKPQTRTRSNVVAPATRSTAARKVVLTQSQVNIAKRLGVPLELYARKVAELEGK
jgi:preprotein translocase subunit SecD